MFLRLGYAITSGPSTGDRERADLTLAYASLPD